MKQKILILEDDIDFRDIVAEFLSESGIDALGAETIKEAIGIYNKYGSDISLFILDLWLPYGNGMDFLKALRKNGNTAPVIIMSGIITEDVKRVGCQLGVIAYLKKPFELEELERVVSKALTSSPSMRRG